MWEVFANLLLVESAKKGGLSKSLVDEYFPYLKRFSKRLGKPVEELIPVWEQALAATPENALDSPTQRFVKVAVKFLSMVPQ